MILAALRDLQWRRRRLVIVVLGTALVLALGVVMSGLSDAFGSEVDTTLERQNADLWVVRDGAAGPFSAGFGMTPTDVDAVRATPGVEIASPLLVLQATIRRNDSVVNATVFGVSASGLDGLPDGVATPGPGDVIVPESIGAERGETIDVLGIELRVSDVVDKASLYAGTPSLYVDIDEARDRFLGGLPATSMVLVRGDGDLPTGLVGFDRAGAREDLLRPLDGATKSVDLVRALLWAVAALVVGSVVFVSVLERTRDIAIFKATGSSTRAIGLGVCVQSVIITVTASALAAVVASLIAPVFPIEVTIAARTWVTLPFVAIGIGVVSGVFGLRRVALIEPASAFAGA